jgi:hypothetical protein
MQEHDGPARLFTVRLEGDEDIPGLDVCDRYLVLVGTKRS